MVWHRWVRVPACASLGCYFPSFELVVFFVVGLHVQLGSRRSWQGLPIGFVHLELWFPSRLVGLIGQLEAFRIGCFCVPHWPYQRFWCRWRLVGPRPSACWQQVPLLLLPSGVCGCFSLALQPPPYHDRVGDAYSGFLCLCLRCDNTVVAKSLSTRLHSLAW